MKTKSILILPTIILGFSLTIFAIYKTLNSPLERLFILVAGAMILVPIIPSLITFSINNFFSDFKGTNKPKLSVDSKGNIVYSKSNQKGNRSACSEFEEHNKAKTYKTKICTTEGYEELRELIKTCSQNKMINRECVLDLKEEIDGLLCEHKRVYKNMEFTNDFHEIYCKLKSKQLVTKDYQYLFEWLSNKLNLS